MSIQNLGLVKNYVAETAVGKYLIVKFGAADGAVEVADDATDLLIGVSTDIDTDINGRCDVARDGIAPVIYGGTVTRGTKLTTNAAAKAVAATDGDSVIGIAEVSGVANDIGSVLITPGTHYVAA